MTAPAGASLARPALVTATDISALTTVGLFLRQAERFGERVLARYYDSDSTTWTPVSWNAFREKVLRVAGGLVTAGVKPQDRVLLLSENRIEWLYCDLAIQAAGAITVPVYANLVATSVQGIATDSGASTAIVSDAAQARKFDGMASSPAILSMDREIATWLSAPAAAGGEEVAARLANLRPDDVATIPYTSGTSGKPKGVVIPHGTIVREVDSCLKTYDIGQDDVILSILPYAHILERIAAFYFGTVRAGARLDVGRGADRLLEDIQAVRPTCMNAVPRLFEKVEQRVYDEIARQSRLARALFAWSVRVGRARVRAHRPGPWLRMRYWAADQLVLRKLRARMTGGRLRFFICGSAPLLPQVEEFFWAIGLPIYQGWGMTELTCAATCNTISEHRLGTVGKALPGVDIRLAPDGEIEVRGPGLMKEYFRNDTATGEALADGWLRTGDIGQIDANGFVTITDRKKDLIKTSGGKYVAPQPIEVELQQDPHIQSAVVVGEGRKYVTALIVPDWSRLSAELGLHDAPEQLAGRPEVRSIVARKVDELNKRLDRFETIKSFRLLPRPLTIEADELTPTLKVKRRVVQQHYAALIDEMYEPQPDR